MSDPNGTEPLSTTETLSLQAAEPPVPPSDGDVAPAPHGTTVGPPGAPGDPRDAGLGYATPGPEPSPPPGGYSATAHPPQGVPARGLSTAPRTSAPERPPAAPGHEPVPVYGAAQVYGPGGPFGAPQPYPSGSAGYAPPPPYQGGAAGYAPPPPYQDSSTGYAPPPPYHGGAPGYLPPPGYLPAGRRTNPYAIASLVCSLAALVTGVSAIAGIVLGHIALNKIKETGDEGRPLAIAGLAVGYGLLVLGGLLIVAGIALLAVFGTIAATTTTTGTF